MSDATADTANSSAESTLEHIAALPIETRINSSDDGRKTRRSRGQNKEGQTGDSPQAGSAKPRAIKLDPVAVIQDIGRKFVELRESGRSEAWAKLESELMTHAHVLVGSGTISGKDWIQMTIEIESFRKSETGSGRDPVEVLSNWLNGSDTALTITSTAKDKEKPKGE